MEMICPFILVYLVEQASLRADRVCDGSKEICRFLDLKKLENARIQTTVHKPLESSRSRVSSLWQTSSTRFESTTSRPYFGQEGRVTVTLPAVLNGIRTTSIAILRESHLADRMILSRLDLGW